MSDKLRELLSRHLTGPRWQVTRDVVTEMPSALDDVVRDVTDDLDLLVRQLSGEGSSAEQRSVDVRITAEHVVLLLGRLLPLTDSVLADLYMTDVLELERDDVRDLSRKDKHYAAELRPVIKGLRELTMRKTSSRSDEVRLLLDLSTVLASLHSMSVLILRELLEVRINRPAVP